ncbi:hypothetical protein DPMN_140215 [Dreissena polymorpha]|uniref:Uncharacterized protein n=1 Tax=Dreissena polymorpha TaxID=45954 RepID=A0A9D4GB46_DREPO|nr:hypothetical protein DPMN_140215 [Dreissena polymorpha]
MSCKETNGTKRRRYESSTSEASRMSTNTQMTDLSLGSSQDDNNVFNDRRESVISDTNNAKLFDLPIVDRQSNMNNGTRAKRIAMRKTHGPQVVFSNDETDGPSEQTRYQHYPFHNGHREFIIKPTPRFPRQRYASNTEGSTNTDLHPNEEPLLHHSRTVPYQMQPQECTCCERQQQLAHQQHVRQYDHQQTYTKSPSVRSLPDSYIHNVRMNNQVYPQRRNSGVPIETVFTLKETVDGTYLHPVCRMTNVRSPRSHSFDILDTIPSGDSAGSTLEKRPLPLRPVVDPSDQRFSVAYYEPVKEYIQALVLPSVSSKGSSESSRSRKCFSCNKFLVLVILNALLILVIISAVPFYLFVVVGGQPIQEGPQQTSVQSQQQHRNRHCVHCSVLKGFENLDEIGVERKSEDANLCCLKAETSIVEFILKVVLVK